MIDGQSRSKNVGPLTSIESSRRTSVRNGGMTAKTAHGRMCEFSENPRSRRSKDSSVYEGLLFGAWPLYPRNPAVTYAILAARV